MRRLFDTAVIALFLAAIAVPGALLLAQRGPVEEALATGEPLAKKPAFAWDKKTLLHYPGALRDYFRDHFGLRQKLIAWNGLVKVKLLGISSSPKVLVGKKGWLYYTEAGGIDDYRGLQPFTKAELDQWVEALVSRKKWLAARRTPYLVAFAPNKESVYPQYLPDWVTRGRQTRADQLMQRLKEDGRVEFIDLRPALRETASKVKEQLYYKVDTHWTQYGAWFAARRILEGLHGHFPAVHIPREDEYILDVHPEGGGDLARFLGLQPYLSDNAAYFVPKNGLKGHRSKDLPLADMKFQRAFLSEFPGGPIPRAVIFHDSYMQGMVPALVPAFARATFVWSWGIDTDVIEREHPDVVISQFLERAFRQVIPDKAPPVTNVAASPPPSPAVAKP